MCENTHSQSNYSFSGAGFPTQLPVRSHITDGIVFNDQPAYHRSMQFVSQAEVPSNNYFRPLDQYATVPRNFLSNPYEYQTFTGYPSPMPTARSNVDAQENEFPFKKPLSLSIVERIVTGDGREVNPKVYAKVDKGFFKEAEEWICYRRNYFSVAGWYELHTNFGCVSGSELFLKTTGPGQKIQAFGIRVTAIVSEQSHKAIDILQFTTKRDQDRKSTRLNSSHSGESRMPSSA